MSKPISTSHGLPAIDTIRDHFPALRRRHGGRPVAYFDGPGGTQVPQSVIDAVTDYLVHHNANTHWSFPTSQETDAALGHARAVMADFLNASPAEIAFGSNMTTLTFHLARALGRRLGPGDEVVVTELDHHANVAPWQAVERERGLTLRTVRMEPGTGQLDRDDLARQINDSTRVVAVGAASNALGTINDIPSISKLARSVGALFFVDAVHYAPHVLVDVEALGCDFLACSAYKVYGPHVGVLYGRRRLLEELDVPKLRPAPNSAPERMETGTQNHEGIVGAAAAVEFLASLAAGRTRRERLRAAYEALDRKNLALIETLWVGLEREPGVRLFGPAPGRPRTPTLSFACNSVPAEQVCRALAERGLFASHGDFYATTAIERLGQSEQGLVRIGCACYSTEEEIDRLLAALREILR